MRTAHTNELRNTLPVVGREAGHSVVVGFAVDQHLVGGRVGSRTLLTLQNVRPEHLALGRRHGSDQGR